MKKNTILLAVLGTFLSAQYTRAQKTNNDTIKTADIPKVTVFGKLHLKSADQHINRKTLDFIQDANLGATLSKISGIQNSYFGPNVGTPVIRSLSGHRVKVLVDGLGINDLSGISPTFNLPLAQEDIESMDVYKGSATVLYGGKAIGGAVNLQSNVIPSKFEDKKITGLANLQGSSNGGFKQSVSVNGNNGKNLLWHIGAVNFENKVVRIPGNTKPDFLYDPEVIGFDTALQFYGQMNVHSENELNVTIFPYISQYVLDHLGDPDYGLSENDKYTFKATYFDIETFTYKPNPRNELYVPGQDPVKDRYKPVVKSVNDIVPSKRGEIPNSHSKANSYNVGLTYKGDSFAIGAGYENNYAYYGVPAYAQMSMEEGHSHDHDKPHEPKPYLPINIRNLTHTGQFLAEYTGDMPLFNTVKLNAIGQYSSDMEILGKYMANEFSTAQESARLELNQKTFGIWTGLTGVSYANRKMTGDGKLRYLPDTKSSEWGFFTSQVLSYKFLEAVIGYRHDIVNREVTTTEGYRRGRGLSGRNLAPHEYKLNQFDSSLKINVLKNINLRAAFNHSERAPEVNELYAGNRHFAIVVEENGDDALTPEQANTLEFGADYKGKNVRIGVNYYMTDFNNYLYLGHTGIARNGFIVKEWRASDTNIDGWEVDASYLFNLGKAGQWQVSGYYDLVKNKNTSDSSMRQFSDGDYMPNMPTSRFGFGLQGRVNQFGLNVSLDHFLKQKYLGKHISPEWAFPAYSLLSARASYNIPIAMLQTEFYAFGTNLLNVEARPQNSQLKYLAPLPGINVGVGVNIKL